MIEKWDITIPELTGDEVRSAYNCLPEAYTRDIKPTVSGTVHV